MKPLGLLILLLIPMFVFSQSKYVWKRGKKVELKENFSSEIIFEKLEKALTISDSANLKNLDQNFDDKNGHYKILDYKDARLKSFFLPSDYKSRSYQLIDAKNNKMYLSHFVRVKFKKNYTLDSIADILKLYHATFIDQIFGIYRFQVLDIEQVLNLANAIYEKGVAIFSQPDFIMQMSGCSGEPWERQYYLHNTNHSYGGFNHDINAFEAWTLTKGSPSTIVAVIDDGVEDHPDLRDPDGNSRVLKGYTPSGITKDGRPSIFAAHGEACAGIIAASHNANIRGIAPNVKILPVKVRFGNVPVSEYSDAIRWAYLNGADILSNSWGGGDSEDIIDAIDDAMNLGRDGKGAVVVFSSGNGGGNEVSPYALVSIAVGAIDKYDKPAEYLSWDIRYTNVGIGQDLVAYGSSVDKNGKTDIRTIDRVGNNGYCEYDYYDDFSGTSASCPQVSGVAALILGINPNLKREEVETILFKTATDLGESGRDNIYGYGKVNAFDAVLATMETVGKKVNLQNGVLDYEKMKENVWVDFSDMPSSKIKKGNYCCDIYKAETTIPADAYFWYWGDGLSAASENTGNFYLNINTDKKTAYTFFYFVKIDPLGNVINKWIPQDPNNPATRKYVFAANPSKSLKMQSDSTQENQVLIYPNPNQGSFRLNIGGELAKNASLQIYDLTGQSLFKTDIYQAQQTIHFVHQAGMYLIRIQNGNTIYSRKLVLN